MWGSSRATILVPLDFRLKAFGLDGGSGFEERSGSESIDDCEEALAGEKVEGCGACD
jgi:hypothetical protein